jgi:hypothetical protein
MIPMLKNNCCVLRWSTKWGGCHLSLIKSVSNLGILFCLHVAYFCQSVSLGIQTELYAIWNSHT